MPCAPLDWLNYRRCIQCFPRLQWPQRRWKIIVVVLLSGEPAATDDGPGQKRSHSQIYCDAAALPSDQRGALSCPAVVRDVAQCLPPNLVAAVKLHPRWHQLELAWRANIRTVRPGAVRAPMFRRAQGAGDTRGGEAAARARKHEHLLPGRVGQTNRAGG